MSWITKHPKFVLAMTLIITIITGLLIPGIVINNSVRVFFPDDHPSNVKLEHLDETYGNQILMVVSLTDEEKGILTPALINHVSELVKEIETYDFVEDVKALTNTDYPVGTEEGMEVGPLIPRDFSGSGEEIEEIRRRLMDWPRMYRKMVYSDDLKATQLIISIDYDHEARDLDILYSKVVSLIREKGLSGVEYRMAGHPVITQRARAYMYHDLSILIPVVLAVILVILFLAFKRPRATLLPVITVAIATVWTFGVMALAGIEFTIITTCLPVLLIAVGSAYGIHVLNHYYDELSETDSGLEHTELVARSVRRVSKPVLMAGLTTIAGFMSIVTSRIVPLRMFAVFSSLGTLFSLILAMTFIPAILCLKPPKDHAKMRDSGHAAEMRERFYIKIFSYLRSRKPALLLGTVIIIAFSIYGLTQIDIESSMLDYFPKQSTMRQHNDYIAKTFSGTNIFSLVIKGEKSGDLARPEILKVMDDLKTYLIEHHEKIGKIISYSDFIRRMNMIMNYPPAEDPADGDVVTPAESSFSSDDDVEFASFFDDAEPEEDASFSSFFDEEDSGKGAAGEVVSTIAQKKESPFPYEQYAKEMTYRDFLELISEAALEKSGTELTGGELVTLIQRRFNYRGAAFDEIPCDPGRYPVETREDLADLISQYLLLYSGSLDEFADDALEPTEACMTIQMTNNATGPVAEVIKDARAFAERNFPDGYVLKAGGTAEMELALTRMVTSSQIVSLVVALVIVFIIIALAFRSILAGLIGCVPLSMAILINFGIMGLTGINLDIVTSLIASIAIGIGVDYTIHFMTNYHEERLKSGDLQQVTRNSLKLSGRAILINALAVGLGFAVLLFSGFVVLRYIGLLVAIIMGTSSLAALVLLPIILNTFRPSFMTRKSGGKQ
ncbi:efflux RND transporter permease subunit [Marispirochaeta aestuarii]|uniref:efflux RND transporter permease subunit n=1 Tax=Marispirochaeta aestuarii TaxID=1963862 RepID=UPI0029C673EF|nr:efflux RND transporter permease subunit [Marispirochaeta aestuarii]